MLIGDHYSVNSCQHKNTCWHFGTDPLSIKIMVVAVTLFLTYKYIEKKNLLLYMYNIRLQVATREAIAHRVGSHLSSGLPLVFKTVVSQFFLPFWKVFSCKIFVCGTSSFQSVSFFSWQWCNLYTISHFRVYYLQYMLLFMHIPREIGLYT